ncbi:MAG: hypothetical protein QF775_03565 [archaeon]|jgi:hypothetical protein|nr:hypothetical protein [Euryarchaeota archaeon]MDP6704536.1 hypothetical protein [archaeon]|tara:strand:+ start:48397 stop:50118 length:1722 start_codon:yes stop_codon:yes gene_type:complete
MPPKSKKIPKIAVIAVFLAVLATLIALSGPSYEYELQELDMHLTVGKSLGFNVDSDAVYFGTTFPGGSSTREIIIFNNQTRDAYVTVGAKGDLSNWVSVSKNNFTIPGKSGTTLKVTASPPGSAIQGNYSAVLQIFLRYQKADSKVSGLAAGAVNFSVTAVGDVTAPVITAVTITSDLSDGDTATIRANVTDDIAVDTVFATVDVSSSLTNYTMSQEGSTDFYSTTFTAAEGTHSYIVTANDTSGNSTNTSYTSFTVSAPPATAVGDVSGGGGGGGGGVGGTMAESFRVHIKAPEIVSAYSDEEKTITVIVSNLGNGVLTDLSLSASGRISPYTITPPTIKALSPGMRATFLLKLTAPDIVDDNEFNITISASSKQASTSSSFLLKVIGIQKPALEIRLQQSFDEIEKLLDEIWSEAEWLALRGAEVSKVFTLLDSAKSSLEEAKAAIGPLGYTAAQEKRDEARAFLEDAVIALGEAQPSIKFTLTNTAILFIALAVLIVSALTIYTIRNAGKTRSTYKTIKSRERAQKGRMDKRKQIRLKKQAALIKEAYKEGHISKKTYEKSRRKLKRSKK